VHTIDEDLFKQTSQVLIHLSISFSDTHPITIHDSEASTHQKRERKAPERERDRERGKGKKRDREMKREIERERGEENVGEEENVEEIKASCAHVW